MHIDSFLAAMLSAVGLALLAPEVSRFDGPLHLGIITGLGIALVFLLHGANLAPERLIAGMRNWRLHLFVQTCTFMLFPVIGVILAVLLDGLVFARGFDAPPHGHHNGAVQTPVLSLPSLRRLPSRTSPTTSTHASKKPRTPTTAA